MRRACTTLFRNEARGDAPFRTHPQRGICPNAFGPPTSYRSRKTYKTNDARNTPQRLKTEKNIAINPKAGDRVFIENFVLGSGRPTKPRGDGEDCTKTNRVRTAVVLARLIIPVNYVPFTRFSGDSANTASTSPSSSARLPVSTANETLRVKTRKSEYARNLRENTNSNTNSRSDSERREFVLPGWFSVSVIAFSGCRISLRYYCVIPLEIDRDRWTN